MNRYAFRRTARSSGVSADVAGHELHRLWEENGQKLTPDAVVEAARPADAPLHPAFEWDDAVAGEQHRLWQARMLIKSVRVVTESSNEPAFVHVKIEHDEQPERFYQTVDVLREQPAQFFAALAAARQKLDSALESFREVEQIAAKEKRDETDIGKLAAILEALTTAKSVASRLQ